MTLSEYCQYLQGLGNEFREKVVVKTTTVKRTITNKLTKKTFTNKPKR